MVCAVPASAMPDELKDILKGIAGLSAEWQDTRTPESVAKAILHKLASDKRISGSEDYDDAFFELRLLYKESAPFREAVDLISSVILAKFPVVNGEPVPGVHSEHALRDTSAVPSFSTGPVATPEDVDGTAQDVAVEPLDHYTGRPKPEPIAD